MKDLDLRIKGLGLRIKGLDLRIQGLGLRIKGLGLRIKGIGLSIVLDGLTTPRSHPGLESLSLVSVSESGLVVIPGTVTCSAGCHWCGNISNVV